jgi:LPXTG-motif cell wall-anchored protein
MISVHASWKQKVLLRVALCTSACALLPLGLLAQDTSTTTTERGTPTHETQIRSGTVVYASGNDLVVRLDDGGQIQHFTVPASQKFQVNGQSVGVQDLKPGTHLTQSITTTTTPKTITTVRTISGQVWHVNAPSTVILRLPDNTNQRYTVPRGTTFTIDGQQRTVFQLRKGMNVTATVVTEEPATEVSRHQAVTGVAPPPPPQMPQQVAVLLIARPAPAAEPEAPAEEPAPAALPKTGSEWPLLGLLGLFSLGAGLCVRRFRLAGSH